MGKREASQASKWILIGTGALSLVAAALVLVVRFYEIKKASAEAALANLAAERARAEAERLKGKGMDPTLGAALPPEAGSAEPQTKNAPSLQTDGRKAKRSPTFQPRSSPTTSLAVGHGKVEVAARAVDERSVIITIVGRDFGNDLSPLLEWRGTTGDLFRRKLQELGLGEGTWHLVSSAREFTIRDGVATLELTWERK